MSNGCVYLGVDATPQTESGQGVKVCHDGQGVHQLRDGPAISTNKQLLKKKNSQYKCVYIGSITLYHSVYSIFYPLPGTS